MTSPATSHGAQYHDLFREVHPVLPSRSLTLSFAQEATRAHAYGGLDGLMTMLFALVDAAGDDAMSHKFECRVGPRCIAWDDEIAVGQQRWDAVSAARIDVESAAESLRCAFERAALRLDEQEALVAGMRAVIDAENAVASAQRDLDALAAARR